MDVVHRPGSGRTLRVRPVPVWGRELRPVGARPLRGRRIGGPGRTLRVGPTPDRVGGRADGDVVPIVPAPVAPFGCVPSPYGDGNYAP